MSHTPLARVAMARDPTWIAGVPVVIGASPLVEQGRAPPDGWNAWGRRDAVPVQERLSLASQWDHHAPRTLLRRAMVTWWRSHHPSGPPRLASSRAWP